MHTFLRLMIYSSDFFRRGSRRLDLGLPSEGRHTWGERCLNATNCFILQTTFDEKKKLNTQKKKKKTTSGNVTVFPLLNVLQQASRLLEDEKNDNNDDDRYDNGEHTSDNDYDDG